MGFRQDDTSSLLSARGQSTLIGVVLLIGMVATISVGVLLFAGDAMSAAEQQSEREQVEQSFVELSQKMSTTSTNDDVPQAMDLAVGQNGAVVMTDTGKLQIEGGNVSENISIGAIEYEGNDGSRIAYQAGGVFSETGEETRVVSAPPITYSAETETLTLPVVNIGDEEDLHSGDVYINHNKTDPLHDATLVENDSVTITVTSQYYRGWEEYFEQQGGPTAVRDVKTYPNNDTGVVRAEFGYRDISDAFRTGAIYANDFNASNGVDIDENMTEQAAFPPLSEEIDRLINETAPPDGELDGEKVTYLGEVTERNDSVSDGVYFAEEIKENGHLDFSLSEGNATLVVNGSISSDDKEKMITVSDYEDGNSLRVYVKGDYNARNGGKTCVTVEGCEVNEDATVIQMTVSSNSEIDFGSGGKARFEGVLYAGGTDENWSKRSSCKDQVCFHSNPSFYGSLVASSVDLQGGGGSIDFEYDEDLQDADIDVYPDPSSLPPQLTYLNIAEHKVDVKNN
ncbi:DUF7289 family protein [Natrinema salifodinae]|uniref:DUF7305 domain-containing protein n=1 Tax=Natrinema salifodinae TaxID=1202768 RepID=A0A1I0P492_9EURY|nr:hypothetical protein [Natrinema salifodinae]SEW09169.1 hypothetical protein SAMN05216285_2132 [Natrinema salifodinae]